MQFEGAEYRVVLCDDDVFFAQIMGQKIEQQFKSYCRKVQIDIFGNAKEMMGKLERKPELFFLDIDMPDMNGLELAQCIREKMKAAEIIFVSNHDEMVFDSIQYTPFRFVRKARIDIEIPEAISAWLKKIEREKSITKLVELATKEGMVVLKAIEIVYIESNRHYLMIHSISQTYKIRGKISDFEAYLKDAGFVRANIAYLVNMKYLNALQAREIILTTEERISISRSRREDVKHTYMEYAREMRDGNF